MIRCKEVVMRQFNEEMIRDYLLKSIAKKNRRISGALKEVVKSNRSSYNNGFNEILGFFTSGLNGNTMLQIFEHIDNNSTKRYSPYHYFDIDTLNAYNEYLKTILSETDVAAYLFGHKRSTASDFQRGFAEAKRTWRELANEKSSKNGYYNLGRPVGVVTVRSAGVTVLSPKKPLTDEQFNKRYNETECVNELRAYLEYKYNSKETSASGRDVKKRDVYSFFYRGRPLELEVLERDYYTDIEGSRLTSITAEGKEGRLYTTNYDDGKVYEGDLYDKNGNLIEANAGGQIFYENKSYYQALKAKKVDVVQVSEDEQYLEDENGQLSIF